MRVSFIIIYLYINKGVNEKPCCNRLKEKRLTPKKKSMANFAHFPSLSIAPFYCDCQGAGFVINSLVSSDVNLGSCQVRLRGQKHPSPLRREKSVNRSSNNKQQLTIIVKKSKTKKKNVSGTHVLEIIIYIYI